ncbi:phage tail protein [Sphingomonas qomolangmaensis]|uniref:Tail fiber protein n=1 Tax=Sphingomonas qomolangmaensis TaxID=2918765 RepID=A0ABY5L9Q0_9SPHN|nr:tail fiber protein [Sphingomonas qomolangmaensis]UUL82454.1 tail fiber protein [Sphingomonas qomolangmaensis]
MSEPFLAEIKLFGFGFVPRGYLACNGQLLPIAQYSALFSLLGVMYGGDGRITFKLPDLRSSVPMGFASTLPQGSAGGAETVSLTIPTLPAHTHMMVAVNGPATRRTVANNYFGSDTSTVVDFFGPAEALVPMDPASMQSSGGGAPHANLQPSLAMNFCIATNGVYPSRN